MNPSHLKTFLILTFLTLSASTAMAAVDQQPAPTTPTPTIVGPYDSSAPQGSVVNIDPAGMAQNTKTPYSGLSNDNSNDQNQAIVDQGVQPYTDPKNNPAGVNNYADKGQAPAAPSVNENTGTPGTVSYDNLQKSDQSGIQPLDTSNTGSANFQNLQPSTSMSAINDKVNLPSNTANTNQANTPAAAPDPGQLFNLTPDANGNFLNNPSTATTNQTSYSGNDPGSSGTSFTKQDNTGFTKMDSKSDGGQNTSNYVHHEEASNSSASNYSDFSSSNSAIGNGNSYFNSSFNTSTTGLNTTH